MKATRAVLIDDAKVSYEHLNKIVGEQHAKGIQNSDEIKLLNSIQKKVDLIKQNVQYGQPIQKKKIPKTLDVQNLWWVELSQFWRMLYTIKGDQVEIVCVILHIIDHKSYDKLFGYRGQ